jgi:hypothetical protein
MNLYKKNGKSEIKLDTNHNLEEENSDGINIKIFSLGSELM